MAAPKRVMLETPRFRLVGLSPDLVDARFCDWLRDPDVAEPLNYSNPDVSLQGLRRNVAKSDGVKLFHVGIFAGDDPIGFYMLNRDPFHRTVTFNVLVGDKAWWGKQVVLETRAALLDHFFAERDVDKAVGMPLARNIPAVFNYKRQGWRLEGTLKGHCMAHDGSGRLDQLQFGLLADEWMRSPARDR